MPRPFRPSRRPMHPSPGMPDSGRFKDQLVTLLWGWLLVVLALAGIAGAVAWVVWAWRG